MFSLALMEIREHIDIHVIWERVAVLVRFNRHVPSFRRIVPIAISLGHLDSCEISGKLSRYDTRRNEKSS
jgi:hypothetical protein